METETPSPAKHVREATEPIPSGRPKRLPALYWKTLLILGAAMAAVLVLKGWRSDAHLTDTSAPITVAVAKVTREDLFNEVTIPAEFRPYVEVELHAKVAGYVDQMNVDFGDKVKAGQLLATLEVPELQDQLHNALAVQQRLGLPGRHIDDFPDAIATERVVGVR